MASDTSSALALQTSFQSIAARHKGDPDLRPTLARGIQVLLAFSGRRAPLTVAEVARKTSLGRAVVRRCIHTPHALGMIHCTEGRYALQADVLRLGHAYFSSAHFITAAQPLLDALSDTIHTNCALAALNGSDLVYLVRSQSSRLTQHSLGMDSRWPAHSTSPGRVLLALLPPDQLAQYLESPTLPPLTVHTVTGAAELSAILGVTRQQGYAVEDREVEMDLVGIAIPVRIGSTGQLLSLSVTVRPRHTSASEMKARYLHAMQQTAQPLEAL